MKTNDTIQVDVEVPTTATSPTPLTTDYAHDHDAPVIHLVRQVLHKGTTLADRVRKLRWKRRRSVATTTESQEATPESLVEEEAV